MAHGVEPEFPVIIAGGGLVGLSTAMFLAHHGVPSLVVERLRGGSPVPRAAHFHVRTLELFRSAGIHDEVVRQSELEFLPEGAIVAMDSLAGRKLADIIPSLNVGVDEALSPCRRLFVTQPGLEPILRRRAERSGAQVVEGCEVVDVQADRDGVRVVVRDVDSDTMHTRYASYVVGADGAHSTVRDRLGIGVDGRGVFSNSITIYFTADLWPQMGGKPLSVVYINNPEFGGFFRLAKDCQSGFLAVNTMGDPESDPDPSNAARDTSESRLTELVRVGAGVPDLDVRIDGVARWRATSDVAQRYDNGRVFLAGDAAHLMPPNGGFGGNTGIADAYDLAWKLALVVKGVADENLLSTYDAERRPVGRFTVEQAYSRYVTRTATYLGATDYQPIVPDLEIELGYIYRSASIVGDESDDDGKDHDDPRETHARPGSRAPHLWVELDGRRLSTLDLFGRGFVLLAARNGADWCDAARKAASDHDSLELDAYCVGRAGLRLLSESFTDAYDVTESGAVLVRPDGFVTWRATSMSDEPAAAVATALRVALAHESADQPARLPRG
jgi:2-polyprenyl-6-methoxyphenol hydroxylase-like FAD-dependent oxidoreductase